MSTRKGLRFLKGGHEYLFGWESGQEAQVVAAFAELARDPRSNITWLDAAILTRQLQPQGRRAGHRGSPGFYAQWAFTWFEER